MLKHYQPPLDDFEFMICKTLSVASLFVWFVVRFVGAGSVPFDEGAMSVLNNGFISSL